MAHFAKLDENNNVIDIVVINNEVLLDESGNEIEQKGIDFCNQLYGGRWIQTSYNHNFRKWYAGIGMKYDADLDAFYVQQPYPSWILNTEKCIWEAPIPKPDNEGVYIWNEESQSWE